MITKEQILEICGIEKESFSAPWGVEELEEMTQNNNYKLFFVEKDGKVAGYVITMAVEDVYEIIRLGVIPEFRGRGIASMLMETALADIGSQNGKVVLLEVRQGNTAARNLYKKNRFEEIAIRKKYYADNGENAIVMKREL